MFSISHFAPMALSSDWKVFIFRHRHIIAHHCNHPTSSHIIAHPARLFKEVIMFFNKQTHTSSTTKNDVFVLIMSSSAFWLCVWLLRNAFLYIRATRLCSSHDATNKSNGCGQFECNVCLIHKYLMHYFEKLMRPNL